MTIQWYPGHMTKARKVIADALPAHDVIIEVVDARMPKASSNPVLDELCAHKPRVLAMSKCDLADPAATEAWVRHYESLSKALSVRRVPIAISTKKLNEARAKIPQLCKELSPRAADKPVRAMVVGIPNVGKSTLVNTLMGRNVAKTGDEPAVTKAMQSVSLPSGIRLTDHPGLLWPKIENQTDAYRLGLGGAIADNALDYETLGIFAVGLFAQRYADALKTRYKISSLPDNAEAILREIGKKRGCLEKGGIVNLQTAGDLVVHDFRRGALGRLSLEWP